MLARWMAEAAGYRVLTADEWEKLRGAVGKLDAAMNRIRTLEAEKSDAAKRNANRASWLVELRQTYRGRWRPFVLDRRHRTVMSGQVNGEATKKDAIDLVRRVIGGQIEREQWHLDLPPPPKRRKRRQRS